MIREYLKKYSELQDEYLFNKYLDLIEEIYFQSKMVAKLKLGDFEYMVKNKKLVYVEKKIFNYLNKYEDVLKYFNSLKADKNINYSMIYIDSNPILELSEVINISGIYSDVFENDEFIISFGSQISNENEFTLYLFSF